MWDLSTETDMINDGLFFVKTKFHYEAVQSAGQGNILGLVKKGK